MSSHLHLKRIRIDPTCHLQLVRHAEQYHQKANVWGQLYGALMEHEAQVTSILPFSEGHKSTREQLEAMERRNDQILTSFNMDKDKIGMYNICYTRNFWDSLEPVKLYQNYIPTSFFLVFDYKARQQGRNPYRGYRLKASYVQRDQKDQFQWSDLQKTDLEQDNPFEEIKVEVVKNDIFEMMMMLNKRTFLDELGQQRGAEEDPYTSLKQNIDEYMDAFEEREEVQKHLNENFLKKGEQTSKGPGESQEATIPLYGFAQYIGQALKLDNYERHFKGYLADNAEYQKIFTGTE